MKLIIFGATGTIGNHVVEQSLDKGYEVSAFSRNKDHLNKFNHPNLNKIQGDIFNPKDVQKAVKGQDIVVIVLGSGKIRHSIVRSEGSKNIIEAMKTNGVKRLICQSTLGAGESKGNLNFFWKNIMFGWFLKQVLLDHELQEKYVKNSGLNWTIVRPAAFTDGERTENYRHGFSSVDKSVKLKISRADVANFILEQFDSSIYLFKSPGLSY
jgi:putative NADH-flavin reductase